MTKIKVNGLDFEIASREAAAIVEGCERVYNALGKPTDTSTDSGWKMVDNLVGVWYRFYPWEIEDWKKELSIQLGGERSVHDALRANGGYIPISFPTRLYKMLDTYLPEQKITDRKFIKKFAGRYPIFKFTNYKI